MWVVVSAQQQPCNCIITTTTPRPLSSCQKLHQNRPQYLRNWEHLLHQADLSYAPTPIKLGNQWKQYQGVGNWEGLLDPLDDSLRSEIVRYGEFVEATYSAFDMDPFSPTYATCRFPKSTLLKRSSLPGTGYKITKQLRATSGIQLPRWMEKAPSWMSVQSSWIGYVAVCVDKDEIARLGRRDVVIAFRGTVTCLEWLENLRANLTEIPPTNVGRDRCPSPSRMPMVESGFLSLYTSRTPTAPSLQEMVLEEIEKILHSYGDEPLSLTITGHSLGASLATLAAYDIKAFFDQSPLVTVISFGGPRVGNRSFRRKLEEQGTNVLRIVNSDDIITKVPGFLVDERDDLDDDGDGSDVAGLHGWLLTQWVYSEIGRELRLSSKSSPYLNGVDAATCHDIKTYLHLVKRFESSSCPFRPTTDSRVLAPGLAHAHSKIY